MIYDIVIIGSGISGCYIANKLSIDHPDYKILIIEKSNKFGGIWNETKWSWLKSDTLALSYCPKEYISTVAKIYENDYNVGIDVKLIMNILENQVKNVDILYENTVLKVNFHISSNFWETKTTKNTIKSRFIINCTGLLNKPTIPKEFSDYFTKTKINFCHSQSFDDKNISPTMKIAVIGTRESGLQITKGLSKTMKIDWYGRSFNNLYSDIQDKTIIGNSQPLIANLSVLDSRLSNFIRNIGLEALSMSLFNILKMKYKYGIDLSNLLTLKYSSNKSLLNKMEDANDSDYNFSNPLKPIFYNSQDINPENIILKKIKSLNEFANYDLVICATGYDYEEPFPIFVDNKQINVDVFYLVNYIKSRNIPNFIFCIPYSPATYISLELFYKQINKLINNNPNGFCVTDDEYFRYKFKVDDFLKDHGIDIKLYRKHFRVKSFWNLESFMDI